MNQDVCKKIQLYAEILKAMGHPTRLSILIGLNEKQCNVNHMVEKLGISQSTVSQHLAILRRSRIVGCTKKGLEVCYRVEDPIVRELINIIIKENNIDIINYCCD